MKKLGYLTAALLLLMTLSCGGGGSPTTPQPTDLTGLIGVWDINTTVIGNLSGPGGSVPLNDHWVTVFHISQMQVIEFDGYKWTWNYDGKTLTLTDAFMENDYDPDCGDMLITGNGTIHIPLEPGSTVGTVSGIMEYTVLTDYCGDMAGTSQVSGIMTKR